MKAKTLFNLQKKSYLEITSSSHHYFKKYIELRSDTKTLPTENMTRNINTDLYGDEQFGEDPTVKKLENKLCELFNTNYATFVPSGTLGNIISIYLNSKRGDGIICGDRSHLFKIERFQLDHNGMIPLDFEQELNGNITINNIESKVNLLKNNSNYSGKISVLALENSVNFCGGAALTPKDKRSTIEKIKSNLKLNDDLHLHLDGSRLLNSSVALNLNPSEFTKDFKTINICLSKGLGCPMGSFILLNTQDVKEYEKLRNLRRTFIGSLRQAGFVCSPALVALEDYKERFTKDHSNAKIFQKYVELNTKKVYFKNPAVTNIISVYLQEKDSSKINLIINRCKEKKLLVGNVQGYIRCVFHHQVNENQTIEASKIFVQVVEDIL